MTAATLRLLRMAFAVSGLLSVMAARDTAMASSCGDAIADVERKLNEVGATSSSANSAGQAVAAERGAHAQSGDPAQNPEASSNASPRKDATGGAGDAFMAAKVAANDARNADRKGDTAGCETALKKAKQLGRL